MWIFNNMIVCLLSNRAIFLKKKLDKRFIDSPGKLRLYRRYHLTVNKIISG